MCVCMRVLEVYKSQTEEKLVEVQSQSKDPVEVPLRPGVRRVDSECLSGLWSR